MKQEIGSKVNVVEGVDTKEVELNFLDTSLIILASPILIILIMFFVSDGELNGAVTKGLISVYFTLGFGFFLVWISSMKERSNNRKKYKILQALINYPEDGQLKSLHKQLLFLEAVKKWPVHEALSTLKDEEYLVFHQDFLQDQVKDIVVKLKDLKPGRQYDELIKDLNLIHGTDTWKAMTKESKQEEEKKKPSHLPFELAMMVQTDKV